MILFIKRERDYLGDKSLDGIIKFLVGKPGRKKPRVTLIRVDGRSKLK